MSSTIVSKRVYLTLADTVYEALERWAEEQGRPVANLAAYLVERAVEQAQQDSKIPKQSEFRLREACEAIEGENKALRGP